MGAEEHHRYSVAWLDLLAEGSKMGRAIVSRADPLPREAVRLAARGRRAAVRAYAGALSRPPAVDVPNSFPAALLRPARFLASGLWKIIDTQAWAQRITQLKL